MGRLLKHRRAKSANYSHKHVNYKSKANRLAGKIVPTAEDLIRQNWNPKLKMHTNLLNMGLVHNLKTVNKAALKEKEEEEQQPSGSSKKKRRQRKKLEQETKVVSKLVEKTQKIKTPMRVSENVAAFVTSMLNSHGEDFKAMARDIRNYDQETWKQIRRKVRMFKNSPDQYAAYLKSRNILNQEDEGQEEEDGE